MGTGIQILGDWFRSTGTGIRVPCGYRNTGTEVLVQEKGTGVRVQVYWVHIQGVQVQEYGYRSMCKDIRLSLYMSFRTSSSG